MHIRPKVILIAALIVGVGVAVNEHLQTKYAVARLNGLVLSPGENQRRPGAPRTTRQQVAYVKRHQSLSIAWATRHEKDVLPCVLPLLNESDAWLRLRAVRILGRLESNRALSALKNMERQVSAARSGTEYDQRQAVPLPILRLAIGRIETKSLRGQARLDELAKCLGLKWADVKVLSEGINKKIGSSGGTRGMVWREILDVIYQMGKGGQDIKAFRNQLVLVPPEKVYLDCATPGTEEPTVILSYFTSVKAVKYDSDYMLMDHYCSLGAKSRTALLAKLNEVVRRPQKYRSGRSYYCFFSMAARLGDRQTLPALQSLAGDHDSTLRYYANSAIQNIKLGRQFTREP